VKRESRKRRRLSWDKFLAKMEHNYTDQKANTYKILKYLNQEIRETGNIKCPLNADTFSQHYKNLWTDANYDQKD
jgi:hypothetical protein